MKLNQLKCEQFLNNEKVKIRTRTYWIVPESLLESCLKLVWANTRVQPGMVVPDVRQKRPLIWEPVWAQFAEKLSASKNLEHNIKWNLKIRSLKRINKLQN
jgi:hypothetical protein